MYVIHINDRPLTLLPAPQPRTCAIANNATHLTAHYTGKPRTLLNYVDMLEKSSPKVSSVDLIHPDAEVLWNDFRAHFKQQEAAGGIVRHKEHGKVLFLFRRGRYDLPKGKIDKGESRPEAALREVSEETGVLQLELGKELMTTYHTFRNKKGRRILKPTYWFAMTTNQQDLTPEEGEGIERAEWRAIDEVLASEPTLYPNLRLLLESL